MRKIVTLALVTLLAPSVFAAETVKYGQATYHFANRRFKGNFEHTLIIGQSLSADFMKGVVSLADGPGTVLSRAYAGHEPLFNLAEPRTLNPLEFSSIQDPLDALDPAKCAEPSNLSVADLRLCEVLTHESATEKWGRKLRGYVPASISLETGLAKIWRWVHNEDDTTLATRRISLMNDLYRQSTAIVGIDAFYLSATSGFDECGTIDVRGNLDAFIGRAYRDGKVMILGNVPKEDYATFSYINQLAVTSQVESCRQEINNALRSLCTPERNCYTIDLEAIVNEINTTGSFKLEDGTLLFKNYKGRNTIRPDGVNLSDRGVQIVVEEALRRLNANPPRAVGSGNPASL